MNPEQLATTATAYIPPELITLGLMLTALSGTFYFVWGIVGPMIRWVKDTTINLTYREIEIHISNSDYNKFNIWLDDNQQHTHFQRSYSVVKNAVQYEDYEDEMDHEDEPSSSKLVAGFGSVVIKAPGMPLVVATRSKTESSQTFKQTETLTFRIFSITTEAVTKFFEQVTATHEEPGPFVYGVRHSYWQQAGKLKSVMDPLGYGAERFMETVDVFRSSKAAYARRGLAYKTGILMFGEPGTGKSSIVAHAAKHFGMHVYVLNSESIAKFDELRADIKKNSFILIDDIDMTVAGSVKRNNLIGSEDSNDEDGPKTENAKYDQMITKDTMRDFMNALDGICEFEGCIIVGNTNNPDVLDDALVRPGRFDHMIEIGAFGYKEQIEHINRFYDISLDPTEYSHLTDRTFAELQKICIAHMDDVEDALEAMEADND